MTPCLIRFAEISATSSSYVLLEAQAIGQSSGFSQWIPSSISNTYTRRPCTRRALEGYGVVTTYVTVESWSWQVIHYAITMCHKVISQPRTGPSFTLAPLKLISISLCWVTIWWREQNACIQLTTKNGIACPNPMPPNPKGVVNGKTMKSCGR